MDQVTQQNAALVEEAAAATGSLESQATQLVQAVAVFSLGNADTGRLQRHPGAALSIAA
jgi:methyl-accepting chemotaxis protein